MPRALAGVGALIITMVLFVMRTEYPDWGRRVARLLVRWAAWAFPEPERSIRREEWEAELACVWSETNRSCTGLTFAGGLAARYGWRGSMRLARLLAQPAATRALARARRLRRPSYVAVSIAVIVSGSRPMIMTGDSALAYIPPVLGVVIMLAGIWIERAAERTAHSRWLQVARAQLAAGGELGFDLLLRSGDGVAVIECKSIRDPGGPWRRWRHRRALAAADWALLQDVDKDQKRQA